MAEDTAKEKETDAAEATEEKKDVEVPAEFKDLVEQIEKMTVLELSQLVEVLEDKFGVSAAAPMMMAGAPAAGGGEEAEEKSNFDVELTAAGDQKIAVIKVVREVTGQGLKDAKGMVDGAPVVVKEGASKEEADELKAKLEEAGATVTLK